jgi:Domain of Unknown Function (DUF928)
MMKLKFSSIFALIFTMIATNVLIQSHSQSNPTLAQTTNRISRSRRVKTLSPSGTGFPGNRGAAASRSNSCTRPSQELIALAPEFKQPNENSVWGQTTSAHPKFWFYMPYTNKNTKLTFTLQNDRGATLYTSKIDAPSTSGVISIQIPTDRPALEMNKNYRWKLVAEISCNSPNEPMDVIGWVSRVNASSTNGSNWYDEVTSLGDLLLRDPSNIQLKQDWSDLLQSATLTQLANQPLIGEAKPSQR